MEEIRLERLNHTWLKVHCSESVSRELSDRFRFEPPNAQFMRRKYRGWDGSIKLYKLRGNRIYAGLEYKVTEFLESRGYKVYPSDANKPNLTDDYVWASINDYPVPENRKVRDYQFNTIKHSLIEQRATIVSPTSSGKSFSIYNIIRILNLKTLLIVPTKHLVIQMYNDFEEYSSTDSNWDVQNETTQIMGGYSKENLNNVTITTWQSVYKQDKEWFDQFSCVICDEVHLASAKSITGIMEKLEECQYRIGFTGTLDGIDINELVLEGLFGPVYNVISTKELIDQGYISDIKIQAYLLSYSKQSRKTLTGEYIDEIKFLISHDRRNKFIVKLGEKLEKNTLILYNYVDSHGKILYDLLSKNNKNVFFVHGGIEAEDREAIRIFVENSYEKCIIVASFGTFSTGTNITNLHNIIFASPSKSRIRNLQSIGRGLRKAENKDKFNLYDIADDLSKGKKKNHTLNHFISRLKIYQEESFVYKVNTIELEK